ncbi:gamma-glutamyl hydrolase A-like [Lycorma delicatula]|uniref:gamma-glutamyl hydrolase A-like n=1 Tax=Lycorma delicatula TaxID=130591 RepID=UPI003F5147F9
MRQTGLVFILFYILTLKGLLAVKNGRPIIGVIAQEVNPGDNSKSFIPAAYVKALESAGARVVPIFINRTEVYYRETLSYINGVLIPGGSSIFELKGGFGEATVRVYNIAKQMNNNGEIFPILGICQGMEILSYIGSNQINPLIPCLCDNMNMPVIFQDNFKNSFLYKALPSDYIKILTTKPVTSNHHLFCLTEENVIKFNLDKEWRILSTNYDAHGIKFISSMENIVYPFAGVQFHPEKPAYEWNPIQHNPHNYLSILVNRYFYDWIVNVSKMNDHEFPSKAVEKKQLIYNYPVTYTPENYNLETYYFKDH